MGESRHTYIHRHTDTDSDCKWTGFWLFLFRITINQLERNHLVGLGNHPWSKFQWSLALTFWNALAVNDWQQLGGQYIHIHAHNTYFRTMYSSHTNTHTHSFQMDSVLSFSLVYFAYHHRFWFLFNYIASAREGERVWGQEIDTGFACDRMKLKFH